VHVLFPVLLNLESISFSRTDLDNYAEHNMGVIASQKHLTIMPGQLQGMCANRYVAANQ